jgi:NAD(P)-dependent dehydrogenase (short-subunit alcohol dehydrogenase family)
MMTKLYAHRLSGDDIRVFEVQPGIIYTDMTAPVKEKYDLLLAQGTVPIARWGQPEDVADAVAMLVGSHYRYSTGEVVHVDGGLHLPRF